MERRIGLLGVTLFLGALAGGCASTGAVPRPFPAPAGSPPGAIGRVSGDAVASAALAFQGTPYRASGTDPTGFDCSGLVQYVFSQHGVATPRSVQEQFRAGRHVGPRGIEPGDLVFFRIHGGEVSHVGIAVGGGEFVHAPSTRGTVRVDSLGSTYWARRYAGARRVGTE